MVFQVVGSIGDSSVGFRPADSFVDSESSELASAESAENWELACSQLRFHTLLTARGCRKCMEETCAQ